MASGNSKENAINANISRATGNETPAAERYPWTSMIRNLVIYAVFQGALLFLAAGRLDWDLAWLYLAASVVSGLASFLLINDPELAAERTQVKDNVKGWDKVLTALNAPFMFGVLVVAGLDVRYGWSETLTAGWIVAGLVVYALGHLLIIWAVRSNRFFARFVRIQTDRGHRVATGGPYRFIRHPGYVGTIATQMAMPLILGTPWALVPAAVVMVLIIIRTVLEDRMLREELSGYTDYARRVRFRLLPGLW